MGEVEVGIAETTKEKEAVYRFRYSVYVEEMGRYLTRADHRRRCLLDPEDEHSCSVYAREGDEIVGSFRLSWGGCGFSARQLDQYQLAPFLAEIPAERLVVGERTMIAPRWRGTDLFERMGQASAAFTDEHGVLVAFGACEPHLIPFYARFQRPYGSRNINSPDAGYLIPLVSFPRGPEALADADGAIPRVVRDVMTDTGTVTSPAFEGSGRYLDHARAEVERVDAHLFRGLDPHAVDACLHHSTIVRFRAGDVILRTGGSARNVFVVLDGDLDVTRDGRPVGRVRCGESLGEVAFVLESARGADVTATTDGTILSLSERTLRSLDLTDPAATATLHRNIARELGARLQLAGTR